MVYSLYLSEYSILKSTVYHTRQQRGIQKINHSVSHPLNAIWALKDVHLLIKLTEQRFGNCFLKCPIITGYDTKT